MAHEVKVAERTATLVLSKRLPVHLPEIGAALGAAFGEVYGYLGVRGAAPEGPPFAIYHSMPVPGEPLDMEICAPVPRVTDAPPGWASHTLPGGAFATLIHVGPYDSVGISYEAISAWIAAHDLIVARPPREVYLSPADTPPDQIRTIIEFPVAKLEVAAPAG